MRSILLSTAALAVCMSGASAQERYDLKLERAAMDRVAARIGDIRPTLSGEALPEFVQRMARAAPVDSQPAPWRIATDEPGLTSQVQGSIQTFSGGSTESSAPVRKRSRNQPSRVIKF